MKIALLIVDIQKEFVSLDAKSRESINEAIEYINAVIPIFRKKNLPIIAIQHINEDDQLIPGKDGFEIAESVQIIPSDIRIQKKYGNAFNKTNLFKILKEQEIDTVLITGYCAEQCVLSTFRGAKDLDIFPMILKGGIASEDQDNIGFVEKISDTVTYRIIRKLLE